MSDSHPTADVPDPGTASFDPFGTRTRDSDPIGEAGQLIAGRYKLIEEIGEGGMGSVWMALQTEPVKRTVAVKLIKAGMDSKAVLARFEAERQALAMMDHPNIARVFDAAATPAGRPFFVMELVKGVPITQYCDFHKLTTRQRLELFVPVCHAIQHAHQKGVIHRDIKPSNVLVALYDDRPVPKVIDFGVAKATGAQLTDRTLVIGTSARNRAEEYGRALALSELPAFLAERSATRWAMVFGNEADGLNDGEMIHCQAWVHLDTFGDNTSYNLSHAVGISLYHVATANAAPGSLCASRQRAISQAQKVLPSPSPKAPTAPDCR